MEKQPLISILIPIYNVESYLPQCLDSIVQQTYKNLQIVLIDDGSQDHSLTICHDYATKDNRIEVYSQKNQGVAATRNHLLEKVKGDYVLFVDSDDWIEADMIENLVFLSKENDADFVMCDKIINDTKPSSLKQAVVKLDPEQAIYDFLHHTYFVGSLWNKLFQSTLLYDMHFDDKISYSEDALFSWQVMKKAKNIVVTNKQLYHYRMNDASLSHLFNGHQFSAFEVWKQIVNDVSISFPEYLSLAQAQFCSQMTVILYYAAKNKYQRDFHTDKLCQIILQYKKQMRRHGCSIKKYIFASIIGNYYPTIVKTMSLFCHKRPMQS